MLIVLKSTNERLLTFYGSGESLLSGRESLRNGLIILALLIGFGVITAVWPILAGAGSSAVTRVPVETEHIELTLPFLGDVSLSSLQLLAALAALVIGPVVVTGAVLAFLSVLASRQVAQVQANSEEFHPQETGIAGLIYKPFEIIGGFIRRSGEKYQGRSKHPTPAHQMPRWSIASTSLIILMFVAFFGLVIDGTFFPEGEIPWNGQVIHSTWITVGIPILLTLLIVFWRLRLQRAAITEDGDTAGIPWDFIAILLTGLLVVGLGIGYIVYLNVPI